VTFIPCPECKGVRPIDRDPITGTVWSWCGRCSGEGRVLALEPPEAAASAEAS
jgi:hypothetical protein